VGFLLIPWLHHRYTYIYAEWFVFSIHTLTPSLVFARILILGLVVTMLKASSNSINSRRFTGVRIVVAGDKRTGKSSLIRTAVFNKFDVNFTSDLPLERLPINLYPDIVPIAIIDTSSRYKLCWCFVLKTLHFAISS
jgi:hypothetical protein